MLQIRWLFSDAWLSSAALMLLFLQLFNSHAACFLMASALHSASAIMELDFGKRCWPSRQARALPARGGDCRKIYKPRQPGKPTCS